MAELDEIKNDELFKEYLQTKHGKSVADINDDALKTLYSSFNRTEYEEEKDRKEERAEEEKEDIEVNQVGETKEDTGATLTVDEGNIDEGEKKELHPWMKPIDEKLKAADPTKGGEGQVAENGKDYIYKSADGNSAVQYEGPEIGGEENSTHNPDKVKIQSNDYRFIYGVLKERKEVGKFERIDLSQIKTPEMAAMMVIAAKDLGMKVVDSEGKFQNLTEQLEASKANGGAEGYNTEEILNEYKKFQTLENLTSAQEKSKKALIDAARALGQDTTMYKVTSNEADETDNASGKTIFSEYQKLKEAAAGKAAESAEKREAEKYYNENVKPNIKNEDGTYKDNPLAKYFDVQEKAAGAYRGLITTYIKDGKPYDGKTADDRKQETLKEIGAGERISSARKNDQINAAYTIMKHYADKAR